MQGAVLSFPAVSHHCDDCQWVGACVPMARSRQLHGQRPIVDNLLRRGQAVYRQGEQLEYLYYLRSGSAKSFITNDDGDEQITAFHFAGDILGLDALSEKRHRTSVMALETASVCRLHSPYAGGVAYDSSGTNARLMQAIGKQFIDLEQHSALLGLRSAHVRFAAFLTQLSDSYGERGLSRTEFNLSMSRQDIANYLTFAVETLSRLFGDFQRRGLIEVDRRYVKIVDSSRLRHLARGDEVSADASAG